MFRFIAIVLMGLVAFVTAKPGIVAPLAYSAPLVAAAPAAAVYSREYHGNFAAPYVASPYVAGLASPYTAAYSAAYPAAYPAAYSAAYPAAYSAYASPYLLK